MSDVQTEEGEKLEEDVAVSWRGSQQTFSSSKSVASKQAEQTFDLGPLVEDVRIDLDEADESLQLLLSTAVHVIRRRRQRCRSQQIRQPRRFWVYPINMSRNESGRIGQLYEELRLMPMEAFDRLLEIVSPHLRRQDTRLRKAITPKERLMIMLRYLATGDSFASLHLQFRVGKSTISGIVRSTCHVTWEHLQRISMPSPTQETWLQAAAGFQSVAGFPNCIGAVDGKHVRVQQPPRSGSLYFNYKKYFSVVLMAVADVNCKFLAIKVGTYGGTGDSRVLMTSKLGRQVLLNQVTVPPPRPLPGTTHPVPFVLVSDEAFPLMSNLLRPYPQRGLDVRRRNFHMRLTRARHFVERTFGILTSKWRIFTSAMQLTEATVDNALHNVIKAACVLHNFLRDYHGPDIDVEPDAAFEGIPVNCGLGRPSNCAAPVREAFIDYFMSPEGALPRHFQQPP
ncbi:uncharacterized protein [Dendropsophus ebraccatus]|uniref:uncharacterized protein n=1 Tax=Dendropsophus ebraccatus TaxID=150705 RepID=UPI0038316474